ncbi:MULTISPECIES: aromatic-ring-hydroxylating dioxygenase subunit beta [unclassified Pseudomonas]|uniref:aromatic-ring-hydroxylating dioxygenase subunit beta n=1 Tax=unclassified Pseudomonas TaxID=196821 RepID=UPI000C87FA42|nr:MULTISPECIES: aromatic-ring-hydroxylating dioxygenase subunit beta [unclassified Pseudomonas]PMX27457.1 ring-hydroxylating dioxygenase subunit beta [Pseudomonas sp. GW460-12]PMX34475.1 ring-hydroxylating dioxygenase subunit beta [Pseudomonas sp. MPR-R2A4]PMX41882.1 ring-hydroxylating dioxygenase subunit beta [Pseudomonas sp. MPR-R2A7]PMX53838.1 ring-hydroxylating dioxygenase subunit beta [Pseudomonas sp. MPR-R2A6]PMX91319.1 ring-hydroxylating dioxygenase subunit beta [Pseudomonas sp. MPR-R2
MSTNINPVANVALLAEITQFLSREARLQDTHAYDDWEALWTDDGVYWVPANGDDIDPETQMSIIFDNRSRIALRIKQFHTGKRHTQSPRSRLGRVLSNVEILGQTEREVRVAANAMVFESNLRGDTVWCTRNEYVLRQEDDGLRMARKKVVLVNNDKALYTLSFLI